MRRSTYKGPAKRDGNHDDVLRAARNVPGLVVVDTHEVGSRCIPGFPDALFIWRGRVIPVEIKRPGEELAITKGEEQLHCVWSSAGVRVEIVTGDADVWRVLGLVPAERRA